MPTLLRWFWFAMAVAGTHAAHAAYDAQDAHHTPSPAVPKSVLLPSGNSTGCMVRVPECPGINYTNLEDRLNCFAAEVSNSVVERPVSWVTAATPFLWSSWTFGHGVVALIMNERTVTVDGGWPEDRCGYVTGPVPNTEKCRSPTLSPEQYAADRLQAVIASSNDTSSYCTVAQRASNCFTSKEDAQYRNAVWLRHWSAFLKNDSRRNVRFPAHNQLMAKWRASDITAIGHSASASTEANDLLQFINSLQTSIGISTKVRVVQFKPEMGYCTADCCTDARTSPTLIMQLVKQIGPSLG